MVMMMMMKDRVFVITTHRHSVRRKVSTRADSPVSLLKANVKLTLRQCCSGADVTSSLSVQLTVSQGKGPVQRGNAL